MKLSGSKYLLLPLLALIAGCSTATSHISTVALPANAPGYHGAVHGGQQPIVGATIQIYTVGTTGTGSPGNSVLAAALTTDANGYFDLTNKVTCPSPTSLIYLVATGGNPGFPFAFNNFQSTLVVALGECGNPNNIQFINVNEVTTVAAVYALAPYISGLSIGSSPSDATALSNAFTLAWQFANITSGTSPGVNIPNGVIIPTAQINTLANLLSACVNSGGGVSGDSSFCGQLFALLPASGGAHPTDTTMALLNLALNPGLNTSGLYNLILATAPFQPTITEQPADFGVRAFYPSDFTISPSSLNFGSTFVSATTASQDVTITNNTTHALTVTGFSMLGANAGDFSADSTNCPIPIVPGGICIAHVSFKPTAAGIRHAYLVAKNTSVNPFLTVSLIGTGTAPTAGPVTVSPSSLDFTLYNEPQQVTLTNLGSTNLNISGITFNIATSPGNIAPYGQTNNCGNILPAQSICTIDVTLHPSTYQSNAIMTIVDDASSGPQTVNLTFDAGSAAFTPPDAADFGVQSLGTTGAIMYSLTNGGSGSASLTLSGPNASDFSFAQGSQQNSFYCSFDRPYSCDFTVYFAPSALGLRTASIAISGIGNIPVSGTGVGAGPYFDLMQSYAGSAFPQPIVSAQYPFLFGGQGSTNTFYIRYAGTVGGTINAPVVAGPHASEFTGSSTCNQVVANGQNCTLTLTYNPTTTENFTTTATIADGTNTYQITIPIQASYAAGSVTASPSTLTFGSTLAGTVSAPLSTTVTALTGNPITATVSGSFIITQGSTCSSTPCQVSVEFAPASNASPGTKTGSLGLKDPLTNTFAVVYLTGVSTTQTTVSVSPGSLSFAARSVTSTSIAQAITVTNTGSTNVLSFSSVSLTGANPTDYVLTNGCTTNVTPGNSCTINVSFSPKATGSRTATVNILSNSATTPDLITLSGTGQ